MSYVESFGMNHRAAIEMNTSTVGKRGMLLVKRTLAVNIYCHDIVGDGRPETGLHCIPSYKNGHTLSCCCGHDQCW